MRRDDGAQVQVIESIIVGILVFVAIAIAAVFRVPTIAGTFEQSELERLGTDVLLHLAAAVPRSTADCNEPAAPCPFESELDRMVSLALRYQGANVLADGTDPDTVPDAEPRDLSPLTDYFNQSLPDGARYVITYSNGVNATRIFPSTLSPPALDVVVSHALITPNWMQYSSQAATSALIQIGEITGFKTASTDSIRDPLNRNRHEWQGAAPTYDCSEALPTGGCNYVNLLSDATGTKAVPNSVVYGTYKFCKDVACATPSYFTIVPPGVYGAGSAILLGDRDNSTTLLARDSLFNILKFTDSTANDKLDTTERLYLDVVAPLNSVTVGDIRLSDLANCRGAGTATCIAGSYVKTGDADITTPTTIEAFPAGTRPAVRAVDETLPLTHQSGEFVYLDVPDPATAQTTGDQAVGAGDRRLSRVGTFRMGSLVATGDFDIGRSLTDQANDFTATTVYYGDKDQNAALTAEEPLYLDLVGNGQDAGIEDLDLRLTPLGSPNLRYTYDVQAVIWFGI
jgi:hypothetical protein